MSAILAGNDGMLCHMDNVFIFGLDHDTLHTIQEARVTLNPEKRSRRSITFSGHVISEQGISADPNKTQTVTNMERPKSITKLRRLMGMAGSSN